MFESVRRRWSVDLLVFAVVAAVVVLIPGGAAAVTDGTVMGTITNSSGAGIAGVQVSVDNASGSDVGSQATGGGGSYSISSVPPGTYYIDVSASSIDANGAADYASQYYGATSGAANSVDESSGTPVVVGSGATVTINQSLVNGGEITGKLTDAATGDPLTGEVQVYDREQQVVGSALSASTGIYTVSGLPSGTFYVSFSGDTSESDGGYYDNTTAAEDHDADAFYAGASFAASVQGATGVAVTSGASSATTVNAALPAGATISGTLTYDGSPAGGVNVQVYDSSSDLIDTVYGYYARTASDGTYAIRDVLAGSYKVGFVPGDEEYFSGYPVSNDSGNEAFAYYSNANSLATAGAVTVTAGQTLTSVSQTLVTGGEVTGTVTDATTGAGVPDIYIELLDGQGNVLDAALSNEDGTYTLDGVPTGSYDVEFTSFAYAGNAYSTEYQTQYYDGSQVQASSTPVAVTAGQTTAGINAALGAPTTPQKVTTVTVPLAPTLTATVPTISGTVKVGDKLTAKAIGWTTGTALTYQWYAAGKAISGAIAPTFTLAGAEYKKAITVAVTGKLSGYNWVTETSAATKAAAEGTLKTVVPKISGTARVGDKLTAKPGAWTKGTKFTYQWYASKRAIKGATKSTFTLASGENAKMVTVKVTGKLTGYKSVAKTSQALHI